MAYEPEELATVESIGILALQNFRLPVHNSFKPRSALLECTAGFKIEPATTYSPIQLPGQYHGRWWA